jgi:aspartyl/asparaginyl beta-hydroxylase (cupin superfamily)
MEKVAEWYSFSENGSYPGSEPAFFNVTEKDWTKALERSFPVILKEFETIIASRDKNIIPYFNETLASKAENWTIFPLYMWSKKKKVNCEKCPETVNIIESFPGMTTCTFSILKPETSIKPHFGDSNVMYRCHLTLKSPGKLPKIGLRVKDETRSWETGKLISFCDAHEHEVWNNTNEERWVLIIDFLREEFETEKKRICAEVNASLWWQWKFQKSDFLSHIPRIGRKMIMKISSIFFY